jgi:hypothetical protein
MTVNDNVKIERTPCEIFSRSMGFVQRVSNFNVGKFSEFSERKMFTENNGLTAGERHIDLLKKNCLKAA